MKWRKICFYLALTVLMASLFFSVKFKTDLSAFFVAGENAEQILLASEMQSGALSSRYILSISAENQQTIAPEFVSQFKTELTQIDGIKDIWSPGNSNVALKAVQALYGQYAGLLYSRLPDKTLDDLLTEQGLKQRAMLLKKTLLSPQAVSIKKIARQDPLLLSLSSFEIFGRQVNQRLKKNPRYYNLILQTDASGLDVKQQQRIQSQIEAVFSDLKIHHNAGFNLLMTGVPVFANHTQQIIQRDITLVSILSSLFISLLFIWIFRSYKTLLFTAALMAAVVSMSILVTDFIFGYVHGITMAIGTTLIGICIDYPIHALVHSQALDRGKRTEMIARVWPSMVLGGLTTLIGYMALGISGYPGFQQIAVYAGTGIIVSLVLTRFVLPALFDNAELTENNLAIVTVWINLCQRFRFQIRVLVIVALGFAITGLSHLHWIKDMQQLTPELDQLKANDQLIRSQMLSSIEPGRFVLVSGPDVETALQQTEQAYLILDQLKGQGHLNDYFGLYPWLLSAKQQQQNLQRLQTRLSDKTKTLWKQQLLDQGLSIKRLSHIDYKQSTPLELAELLNSPIKRLIENQIVVTDQQTLIMIWLTEHQPKALQKAFADISGIQYFSQRDLFNRMASDYQQRAKISLSVGLVLIFLLLLLRYKNVWITLQVLLPAILSAIFILAAWSLTGQAVSFLHLVGFLLAVAICVDYGIFYRENRGGNIVLTYQAMAASMLTSAIAFGCLAVAETSALKTLSQVVALGVVLGFLLCPLIIKNSDEKN